MKTYLEIAREGKNDWWRYLLSLPFILFMWTIIGSIPIVFLLLWNPSALIDTSGRVVDVDALLTYLVTLLTFIPFFLATLLAVRFIHARPMRTLITAAEHIRWERLMAGFGLWFLLSALLSVVEALLYPGRYTLTLDPVNLIPFALASLLLIPFQTSAEELFFRGYLIQWLGLKLPNRLVLSLLSGFLFALPHIFNPEVSVDFWLVMSSYFAIGVFLAWISLQDNGLELALGVHAANNLYTSIFANYTNSALLTPAIFTINTLDPVYGLLASLVAMLAFYLILFWPAGSQE